MCNSLVKALAISFILWIGLIGIGVADNKVLKDPTAPQLDLNVSKASKNSTDKDFHLTAIFIAESERHAVINDKVVKKGDLIGSKVVQAIDPYTVTLMDEDKESVLYLLGSETSIKGQPK